MQRTGSEAASGSRQDTGLNSAAEHEEIDQSENAELNENQPEEEETEMSRNLFYINLSTGKDTLRFEVQTEANAAADALLARLPLSLSMDELNGNEKYVWLDQPLPANPRRVQTIHKGDLMLYQDNCLVLFFKDFGTPYSYTPIGRLTNPGQPDALPAGTIEVTLEK